MATRRMGAGIPPKETVRLLTDLGKRPKMGPLVKSAIPASGVSPAAAMIARLQGESAPTWRLAAFRKLLGLSWGPGGLTVTLKVAGNPLAVAVTVAVPADVPADTVMVACPLLLVTAEELE